VWVWKLKGILLGRRIISLKTLFAVSASLLVLSVVLAVVSIYPVQTGQTQSVVLLDDVFHLSSMETRRQGLGSFHGGENITIQVQSVPNLMDFSVITYRAINFTEQSAGDVTFSFIAGVDYYEVAFYCLPLASGDVHLTVTVDRPAVEYPCSVLGNLARVLFVTDLFVILLAILKVTIGQTTKSVLPPVLPAIGQIGCKRLFVLLFVSLIICFSFLAINTNYLADFENWYTDHARHPYTSTLFLTKQFAVFDTPLGDLSNIDTSYYKFVTWPEMPHLYPVGSIFLFMPFSIMLQNGVDPTFVFKLEISMFLVVAHVCLYFFLKYFWQKPLGIPWKLLGVYIIYVSLILFAANGMFDSVAFLFSLFGLLMFLTKRYDYFILLIGISVFFKYQAGIFLLPLIIYALVMLYRTNIFFRLVQNKVMLVGLILFVASGFTAFLSVPSLMKTRPELVMNGINAFSPHSQIPWWSQTLVVILTLVITFVYAAYVYRRNSLMAFSAMFMLLPCFMLPYVQNWYIPFLFVYILVPTEKRVLVATMGWLVFLVVMLSFGGASFNPFLIIDNIKALFHF
jgi:hypothetical protein